MAMKFYMTPGSCSTGIHILLETLELPFEAHVLNLPAGQHRAPAYLALNPKGTIPALVLDDGRVLTEFGAIAYYLARQYPRAGLLATDPAQAGQALALLDFAVGQVHGQGWTRVFTPEAYLPAGLDPVELPRWREAVQARGRELVQQGLALIEGELPGAALPQVSLPGERWAAGAAFGIADAALFYVMFWADKTGLPLPPRCAAHYQRVRARPVVQRVLAEEGYR